MIVLEVAVVVLETIDCCNFVILLPIYVAIGNCFLKNKIYYDPWFFTIVSNCMIEIKVIWPVFILRLYSWQEGSCSERVFEKLLQITVVWSFEVMVICWRLCQMQKKSVLQIHKLTFCRAFYLAIDEPYKILMHRCL